MKSQQGTTTTEQAPAQLLVLCPDRQELSLSGHALKSAPSNLWDAHWLIRLDLSNCSLANLPPEIQQLRLLEVLNLRVNALKSLPPQIGSLQRLTDLNLASNLLTTLPSDIGRLTGLVYLNLMANRLEHLPDELGSLSALYRLGLKSNKLTALPATVGKLHSLVELFLTDNLLESLPQVPRLALSYMTSVSHWCSNPVSDIPCRSGSVIPCAPFEPCINTALPQELGRCSRLVKLQASFNRLASLPPQLASLPKLELMRVAVNCLTQVLLLLLVLKMPFVRAHSDRCEALQVQATVVGALRLYSLQCRCVTLATGAQGPGVLPKSGVGVPRGQPGLCSCAAAAQPDQDHRHGLTGTGEAARRWRIRRCFCSNLGESLLLLCRKSYLDVVWKSSLFALV